MPTYIYKKIYLKKYDLHLFRALLLYVTGPFVQNMLGKTRAIRSLKVDYLFKDAKMKTNSTQTEEIYGSKKKRMLKATEFLIMKLKGC